ncbi:MAG: sulfotransferase family protein [Marinibacterium sp.]|nr:sulfotransferase family protein [Marinibacterium sp.]
MGLPGTWMTESGSVVYRVVPKCACSTIGQILYFSDHGRFFDGDIHDAETGLHKWAQPHSQPVIRDHVLDFGTFAFTCVRNPYSRILSAFFDKICAIQRNGSHYRGHLMERMRRKYGIDIGGPDGGEFDQIRSFRRFVLFARDTIRFRKPTDPDIHWSAVSKHLGTFVSNGGRFDRIIWAEDFSVGMAAVLSQLDTPHRVDLATIPRFNDSAGHGPERAHPVEAYFDDLTQFLVQQIYARDFDLFNYDPTDPARRAPLSEIDPDRVHAALAA